MHSDLAEPTPERRSLSVHRASPRPVTSRRPRNTFIPFLAALACSGPAAQDSSDSPRPEDPVTELAEMTEVTADPARTLSGTDWPQWRGPRRDGRLADANGDWPGTLEREWSVTVGDGYSSPVVAGGRVFVHQRRNGEEALQALDLGSGELLWEATGEAPFAANSYAVDEDAGPFATPLVVAGDGPGGLVYSFGVNGVLEGRSVRDGALRCRLAPPLPDTSKMFTGAAMSPLLARDGAVVVHVGDDRGGRMVGFDCAAGQERWSWSGDGPGYASPILFRPGGADAGEQIVTMTDRSVVALDPASGELLWRFDFPDEWNENIVTPLAVGDLVIVAGVRRGTLALRPVRRGESWQAEVAWERPERTFYMSSPVLFDGLYVGLSNKRKGQLVALDPATGEDRFEGEGRFADGASLVVAGEQLLVFTQAGELVVLAWREGRLEETARIEVADSAVRAHPAVAGDLLLVRAAGELIAWRIG